MILQFPPSAPWYLHAGAALLLTAHIGGGAVGMASGAVAMIARKGGRLHRRAGTVFFAAMLSMAGVGAAVSPFLPEAQWINTTAGIVTLYLVVTGWLTAKRRDGQIGRLERWAFLVPAGVIATVFALAAIGSKVFGTVLPFAILAAVAAAGDVNMMRQGGLSGASRTARHIWRISLALGVAMGSFFLGQPKFVPEILKDTGLNFVPPLAVLALLVFWMIRVRLPRRRKSVTQPVAA